MSEPHEDRLLRALREEAPDNQEWPLLFRGGQVIRQTHPPLAGTPQHAAPRADGLDASIRLTPLTAAIPIVDDFRVLSLFGKHGVSVPTFLLAGEREQNLWPADAPLRVGILTAGGNAPGLNMVVDSATKRHHEFRRGAKGATGLEVYGYVGGYPGLIAGQRVGLLPSERMVANASLGLPVKGVLVTDKFALEGCTRLKTSRGDRDERAVDAITAGIVRDQLNVVHMIGGDGTLTAAHLVCERLKAADYPAAIVCAPKTMDNDVLFADPSFGFYTVIDQSMEAIRRIASEAETQDRVAIIQLFGAGSGFTALYASYVSGEVDWVILPEMLPRVDTAATGASWTGTSPYLPYWPPMVRSADEYAGAVETLKRLMVGHIVQRLAQKGHAVVVIAEGAVPALVDARAAFEQHLVHEQTDEFRALKARAFQEFVDWLKRELKKSDVHHETMYNLPQHLIRACGPNGFDAALCKLLGKLLADSAMAGFTDCAVSMWHGRAVLVPLALMSSMTKQVHTSSYFAASMLRKLSFREEAGDSRPELEVLVGRLEAWARRELPDSYAVILDALALARRAHQGQARKHGTPYLEHPLRVALSLTEEPSDKDGGQIVTALLHDVLEDGAGKVSAEEIRDKFGERVLELIKVLTSPTAEEIPDKAARNRCKAEKVSRGPPEAWRIKLADRIDNLRDALLLEDQGGRAFAERYCQETRDYYLPLAMKLGDWRLSDELQEALTRLEEKLAGGRDRNGT